MQQPTQIHKIDEQLLRKAFTGSNRAYLYAKNANAGLASIWLSLANICVKARDNLMDAWPKFEEGWAQKHNAYLSAKAGITKNPEACEIELKSYIEAWRVKLKKICEGGVVGTLHSLRVTNEAGETADISGMVAKVAEDLTAFPAKKKRTAKQK